MAAPGRMNGGGNSERSRFNDRFNDEDEDEDDEDDYSGGGDEDDDEDDVPMNKSRGSERRNSRQEPDATIVDGDELGGLIKSAVASALGGGRSVQRLAKAVAEELKPFVVETVAAQLKPIAKSVREIYTYNQAFADHADEHFAALHETNTQLQKAYEGLPDTIAMVKAIADKGGETPAGGGGPSPAPNGSAPTPEEIAASAEKILAKSFAGGEPSLITPASPAEVNKAIQKAEALQDKVNRPCEGLSEVLISKSNGQVTATQFAALNEGIAALELVASRQ